MKAMMAWLRKSTEVVTGLGHKILFVMADSVGDVGGFFKETGRFEGILLAIFCTFAFCILTVCLHLLLGRCFFELFRSRIISKLYRLDLDTQSER